MLDIIINLTKTSFFAPRLAAERLLSLSLDRMMIFAFFLITVCLSVVAIYLSGGPAGDLEQGMPLVTSPIRLAAMIFAATVLSAIGIQSVGRFAGGQAGFDEIMMVMAWQQWLQFLMQTVMGVLSLVALPVAAVMQFVVLWYSFWILFNMVRVAYGFDGMLKSIFVVMVGSFAAVMALGVVTMLLLGV